VDWAALAAKHEIEDVATDAAPVPPPRSRDRRGSDAITDGRETSTVAAHRFRAHRERPNRAAGAPALTEDAAPTQSHGSVPSGWLAAHINLDLPWLGFFARRQTYG
jgi:hypothetical protein